MTWASLLFMHWPVDADALRRTLPAGVELDLHGGRAWIGVIPFTMPLVWHARLPRVPGLSAMHELNVRTYVRAGADAQPGVWFFSLDASLAPAVWAARMFFHLNYLRAKMELRTHGSVVRYTSRRKHLGAPKALFDASWRVGEPLARAQAGSLEHFLTERYCLYTTHRGRVLRGRIHHEPWRLREATLEARGYRSTMIEAMGIAEPEGAPLLHAAETIEVEAWGLEGV